ncbi:MAG TPA: hypothetical protein VE861_09820 [Gemmatimonadaceae bacterium]|nr:hypothetical protein [Gemmatimonadaceae bacterium]
MRTRPLHTIAAAALLTIAASPLAAQRTSAIAEGSARVVATYDFRNAPTTAAFPRSVTVADSAGVILARVTLPGVTRSVPMEVTVIESNLVLQGETPDGLLTLVLDRQNEGGEVKLDSGTWTLGKAQGRLRGTTTR